VQLARAICLGGSKVHRLAPLSTLRDAMAPPKERCEEIALEDVRVIVKTQVKCAGLV